MLIVLVGLYACACLTQNRNATLVAGTVLAALLHPAAAATALAVVLAAFVLPQGTTTARLYVFVVLAAIATKNSLTGAYSSYLVGVSFVLFQGYYTILRPPASLAAVPNGVAHLLFYPQLLCGPIIPPRAYEQPHVRRHSSRRGQYAHCLFAAGMILKIWCSDLLASVTSGPDTGIFHGFLLLLQLYADFAGWCLMGSAIGLACGIAIPRNFRFPFRKRTAADAWRSWNTTLNHWVRVALPLRAMTPALGRFGGVTVYCAVLALWHGMFANFFFYMGLNIFFFWWQARLRSPGVLRLSTYLLFLTVGFTFFDRMPTTWIGLPISALDQVALAIAVVLLFEAGVVRRIFAYRHLLERQWWLMPTLIFLLFAFRPAGKAFMYTRF